MILSQTHQNFTPSAPQTPHPKVVEAEPVTKCTQCNKVKPAKDVLDNGVCHSCYLADLPF